MKKIFYDSFVARMLLKFSSCHTIMLFGLVFSKQKSGEMTQATRNHECVHARQWVEVTLVSGFILLALTLIFGLNPWWLLSACAVYYLWYVIEWIIKGINYTIMYDEWECKMETPYRSISFEREARLSERDPNYLENSRYFAWIEEL